MLASFFNFVLNVSEMAIHNVLKGKKSHACMYVAYI